MAKAKKKTERKGPKAPRVKPPRIASAVEKDQGRYDPSYVEQARKLAALGATDREVAEFFGVAERNLHRWKHMHPEFCEALKVGKDTADNRVEQSLYRRAVGYSHDAVKIFMPANAFSPVYAPYTEHVAPDTTACIFWLKNRRKDLWRDQVDHKHSGRIGGNLPGALKQMTDADIEAELRELRAKRTNGSGGATTH